MMNNLKLGSEIKFDNFGMGERTGIIIAFKIGDMLEIRYTGDGYGWCHIKESAVIEVLQENPEEAI